MLKFCHRSSFLLSASTSPNPAQSVATLEALPYGFQSHNYRSGALLHSELVEYAYSYRPVAKGAELAYAMFGLIPHKLQKIAELLEHGKEDEASR